MNGESVVFWTTAIFSIVGALGMVVSRKAVHSALWVAFTMVNIAILYFSLGAPFLGTTQVIVYTGAVMMLFLFVLMIVGVDSSDSLLETIKGQRLVGLLFALSFGGMLIAAITSNAPVPAAGLAGVSDYNGGQMKGIANLVFGTYLLAFEVTSALLITAALGAMLLAHQERWTPRKTQDQLQRERTLGNHVTPQPAPGVLATNNSVDTPALLPDGSTSEASLPAPFKSHGSVDTQKAIDEVSK